MIAAARRRLGAVLAAAGKATRRADRAAVRRIERMRPVLRRRLAQARALTGRTARGLYRRLRPVAVLGLRGFSQAERGLRRVAAIAERGTTRASAALTPARGICLVIATSAICLLVAQFVSYSSVEIGQPAYAGLPSAAPPTIGAEKAGQAHAYLLVPLALMALLAAAAAWRRERRGLGRIVALIGLLCLVVILAVDLPAGLDVGAQSSRFAGATAVLEGGFYGELAGAAGLLFAGLLYYARPCRIRINLSGRAASARRRRRRRRGSSRRRAVRRPSQRHSAAASARASRP
jgi:hypothetical protein